MLLRRPVMPVAKLLIKMCVIFVLVQVSGFPKEALLESGWAQRWSAVLGLRTAALFLPCKPSIKRANNLLADQLTLSSLMVVTSTSNQSFCRPHQTQAVWQCLRECSSARTLRPFLKIEGVHLCGITIPRKGPNLLSHNPDYEGSWGLPILYISHPFDPLSNSANSCLT